MINEEIDKIFQEVDNNKLCTILFKDTNHLIADFKKVNDNKYNFLSLFKRKFFKTSNKKVFNRLVKINSKLCYYYKI